MGSSVRPLRSTPVLLAALVMLSLFFGSATIAQGAKAKKGKGKGNPPAAVDVLATCKGHYVKGRYTASAPACEEAAQKAESREEKAEGFKLAAFSRFLIGQKDEAKLLWEALRTVDPAFVLDPINTSPDLLEFFGKLETPAESEDAQTVESVSPAADGGGSATTEVIHAAPSETTTPAAEPESWAFDAPKESTDAEVPCRPALCLIPGGIGQFINGDYIKGTIFAVLEVGLLATNLGLYWGTQHGVRVTAGSAEADAVEQALLIQRITLYTLVATAVLGIVEAYIDF